MEFKRKAGLALALAAIFTTGGVNMALAADNVTATNPNDDAVTGEEHVVIDFTVDGDGKATELASGNTLVVNENVEFTEDMKDVILPVAAGATVEVKGGQDVPFKDIELKGTLQLGDATEADSAAKSAAVTSVTLSDSGAAVTAEGGGSFKIDTLNATKANATVTISGDSSENEATTLTVGKLNATAAITINVGSATGAGDLLVTGTGANAAKLSGSTIFADPAWLGSTATGEEQLLGSSKVTIAAFTGNTIDGKLAAGQRSFFTVGKSDPNWMMDIIRDTGRWGTDGITAGFGLYTSNTLDTTGYIYANGAITSSGELTAANPSANSVTFADKSLYAVNLNGQGNAAALTLDSAAAIQLGANAAAAADTKTTFYGYNPRSGVEYTILTGISTGKLTVGNGAALTLTAADESAAFDTAIKGTGRYWYGENLLFSSDLFEGEWSLIKNGTTYDLNLTPVYVGAADMAEKMPLLSDGVLGLVDSLLSIDASTLTPNDGTEFIYNTLTSDTLSNSEKARVLESAARATMAAAVPAIANSVAGKLSSLVVAHNNMLNAIQPAYGNEPGRFGLWLNPFYGQSDVDGLKAGQFKSGYELTYGGAALGLDYNLNEALRIGLALNVGGGESESQGGLSNTENTFDFFGATLYGSWSNGAFDLTGDLGYTAIGNDIDQRTPQGRLDADVDSDVLSLGLTGQYRFAATENLNITPHLGLRYTKISADDANLKLNGGRALNISTDDQNLFQIPVGVKFSNSIVTDGGWTVTPSADLGVLFTTGDTEVDSKASVFNYPSIAGRTTTEAADEAAFTGALGLKMAADNGVSLGLDYGILASGNQTDHSISGMLRFEF